MEEVSAAPAKTFYLFWDPSDKSWNVGDLLGGGKVQLKSSKSSRAGDTTVKLSKYLV